MRLQDNFRNDYRRDSYRKPRYWNRSGSRDYCRDTYRNSSREEHLRDRNFSGDRSRTIQ